MIQMKKLVFIVAIAVILMQNDSSGQAKNNNNENKLSDTLAESALQNNGNEGGTVKLTKAKFLAEVWDYENSPKEWKYKGTKPAMIDFYADWCGPCRTAAPILEEISKEYAGKIIIYKVDTQVEQELKSVFGITGIPFFFRDCPHKRRYKKDVPGKYRKNSFNSKMITTSGFLFHLKTEWFY
jgi:thioredoxin 1